jgi:membrane associated rhomboid family serine protease
VQQIIPGFTQIFFLSENAISMPWQFFTAVFLHGSLIHLIFNLFALLLFGFILEGLIGSKRFLILFIVMGVLANFVSFFWFPNALGASGAIMGVMGCLAILRPTMTVWAFNLPMPMIIAAALWAGAGFLGIFGFGEAGVGHLAHLVGLFLGVFYGLFLRLNKRPNKNPNSFIFESKVVIPEDSMRAWENRYLS